MTLHTVILLLATSGLRISEALHLTLQDVGLAEGVLSIRQSKFRKSRLVPVSAGTLEALRAYHDLRLGDFPAKALDALIATMSAVIEYPDDPMRTFPTNDPHVRRAEFGGLGLVTYVINDAQQRVTLTDVTWTG